ncbi:imc sub-compartment protein isp2 [Cystoisospora suis]|uniref:Imc sub-compartment protein isp2 n=1 Tax=Cystoisospora suis TaxID=483139 RepID=A0A2C6LAT2_9APIC|nr:imc sub-compartment protein isp2 [Cystoisospora suis]
MGNACQSCCGDSVETQMEIEAPEAAGKGGRPSGGAREDITKNYTPDMLVKLQNGFHIDLILQDKSRLDCVVKLLPDNSGIELSCDRKSRVIKFSDIRTVLYTPEQLKRVDYSAGISGTDYCVALHLAASGNCIPLFFANASDRDCFATTVEKLRSSPSA